MGIESEQDRQGQSEDIGHPRPVVPHDQQELRVNLRTLLTPQNSAEYMKELHLQRGSWIQKNVSAEERALCLKHGITIPEGENSSDKTSWGDWKWHLQQRLTSNYADAFLALFPEYQGREELLREYLGSYDLSILPLNLSQPEGIKKFLPRLGLRHSPDPYGVQKHDAVVLKEHEGKRYYLSTHKKGYASFLPILGGGAGRVFCPVGCAGCYRGPQTRLHEPLAVSQADGSRETVWIPTPEQQTQWLVEEWNSNPEFADVYDVLFSGGEPMMLSNETWRDMMQYLKEAKHLKSFRVCTGSLFLGLPFRFDDELIRTFTEFREQTGIQVKLSVHVSHPEHITPEALHYANKLKKAGVELLPQCPLEPGVNFWMDDLDKTEDVLRTLDRSLSLAVGTRAYKWILDMQGGVSLLPAIEVWRRIHDRHQEESDITRPTSFALFLPQAEGNTNLSYHSLWAIQMQVDKEHGVVRYQLPHPSKKMVSYEEPLIEGVNDDISRLEALKS